MPDLIIRFLSERQPYDKTWQAMRLFTDERTEDTPDEIWLLEHQPVFTQGQAGKPEHIINPHNIPVVQTDRGGQVTYHGPGQLMAYTLFDVKRLGLSTRDFVRQLERIVIDYLININIPAVNNDQAPGVYVNKAKICSIGLRLRKGYSYHGLAFNVDMNIAPFSYINPCGYKGLAMSQVSDYIEDITIHEVAHGISKYFVRGFKYQDPLVTKEQPMEFACYEQQTIV